MMTLYGLIPLDCTKNHIVKDFCGNEILFDDESAAALACRQYNKMGFRITSVKRKEKPTPEAVGNIELMRTPSCHCAVLKTREAVIMHTGTAMFSPRFIQDIYPHITNDQAIDILLSLESNLIDNPKFIAIVKEIAQNIALGVTK